MCNSAAMIVKVSLFSGGVANAIKTLFNVTFLKNVPVVLYSMTLINYINDCM